MFNLKIGIICMANCGQCQFIHIIDGQSYHDCRESSPQVIVPTFKPGDGNFKNMEVGKIMTVWPRVSVDETACGKFKEKVE